MFRSTAVALALVLTACPGKETMCTEEARSSIELRVVDEAGAAIAGATATFTPDGGVETACETFTEGADGLFVCGWEVDGSIALHVEAPGYLAWDEVVDVGADECHVISEDVTATLLRPDCTDVEVVSVEAHVTGTSGETLTGTLVSYTIDGGVSEPCEANGSMEGWYFCGWEEVGAFVITAIADGHGQESVEVEVTADACHVITQTVEIGLDWLPD